MGRLFAFTLVWSAFLLFTVQPLVARMLLPFLGGTAVVWNTSMVFFQALLVAGYAWAHYSARWFGTSKQRWLHVAALACGAIVLPIAIGDPDGASTQPIAWLLTQLTLAIALPFFALSASAPMLQRWYADSTGDDPYWLYAASNVGSFAALFAYPLALEPFLGVTNQSLAWSIGYGGLIVLTAVAARMVEPSETEVVENPPTDWALRLEWVGLAAIPSGLLLAVTTSISTDLASTPLLWVVPLALYLASFVVVFAAKRLVSTEAARIWVVLMAMPMTAILAFSITKPIWLAGTLHLVAFTGVCLLYHGRLADRRPAANRLTEFYLWMSIGGVVGGAMVSLVAPLVFDARWEYALLFGVAFLWLGRHETSWDKSKLMAGVAGALGLATGIAFILGGRVTAEFSSPILWALFIGLAGASVGFTRIPRLGMPVLSVVGLGCILLVQSQQDVVERTRSQFASYWVAKRTTSAGDFHVLYHGHVRHGAQSLEAEYEHIPLSYFHYETPIGDIMNSMSRRGDKRPVAVVGLGVGSLAAYAQPDQRMRFIEIDPAVAELARDTRYFSYLEQCAGSCDVVIGDGRVALADEPDGQFQMIVIDAYNSDSIPTHLLTVEAFELYMQKLTEDGVLVLHVSNTFLDVGRVAENIAATLDLPVARNSWWPRESRLYALQVNRADYIAIAKNRTILNRSLGPRWKKRVGDPDDVVWTDDYANILAIYTWE